ncbi:hypothetical protein L2755_03205 [Shewanella abyssi]|uniref:hypothetical protein n=1 Tax=Shewanella abyssi TaxID=311789 RepID=UPI0020104042|nr:hypothetical protein [Shewanella abyssi]MCL1048644.1 hypothetical protein [Shewanella abyssi]
MQYDKSKYQILQLPSPLLLFRTINPMLAINELILGQRLPKVTLIEKDSKEPLLSRQVVPCPHCNAMNPGSLWSNGNAFGHWFGYVCPECSGIIPCLWNLSSLLLLTLSAPVWLLLQKGLKKRWLAISYRRVTSMKAKLPTVNKDQSFIKTAQAFAVLIFLFMLFIQSRASDLSFQQAVISLVISSVVGVMFGKAMSLTKLATSKKRY